MISSHDFVAGLVGEMQALFSRLADGQALEAEARGNVDVVPLLRAALKSELASIETDVARLIEEMEASIARSQAFIKDLEQV